MAGKSLNRVQLLGWVSDPPELRMVSGDIPLCRLKIATSESYKQGNEWVTQRFYHTVVLWRRTAEIAEQYLREGSQVYIEGRLQTRKWEDREGNTRWITEVQGRDLILLGSRRDRGGGDNESKGSPRRSSSQRSGYPSRLGPSQPKPPQRPRPEPRTPAQSAGEEDFDDGDDGDDLPF